MLFMFITPSPPDIPLLASQRLFVIGMHSPSDLPKTLD